MRVHANQINQNAQLDAMYAAQKAAARREAARTRKKLLQLASELAGESESEACVVKLGAREGPGEQAKRKNEPEGRHRLEEKKEQREESAVDDAHFPISDWA